MAGRSAPLTACTRVAVVVLVACAALARATSDCTELAGATLAGQSSVTSTFLGMAPLTDTPASSRSASDPVTFIVGRGNNVNSSYFSYQEVTVTGASVVEGPQFVLPNLQQANVSASPNKMLYQNGILYVGGTSLINLSNQTTFVYAYDVAANYTLLWTALQYCVDSAFGASLTDMALFPGGNGDLVVAGYTTGNKIQGATLDGTYDDANAGNVFAARYNATTGALVWSSQTVFSSQARSLRLACSSVSQQCHITVIASGATTNLALWTVSYATGATVSTATVVSTIALPSPNDNAILVIDTPAADHAVYIAYSAKGTGTQYNATILQVTPSSGAITSTYTVLLGSIASGNLGNLQTVSLLNDDANDLYLVARVPYGLTGPTTGASLHLRKFNSTTGSVVYTQILTAGSSSIAPSVAFMNGPHDAVVVGGTTAASINGQPKSGATDVFVVSYTANPNLGGPYCTLCVGASCPTPSPLPINTAAPTSGLGSSTVDPNGATLPAWAFAIIAVAAVLVLVAVIFALVILYRRSKAQKEMEKKDLEMQQRAVERSRAEEQRIAEAEASGSVDPFRVPPSQDVLLPDYSPPAYAEQLRADLDCLLAARND